MELIIQPHASAILLPGKKFPLPMPGFKVHIDQPVTYSLHRQRYSVSVVVVVRAAAAAAAAAVAAAVVVVVVVVAMIRRVQNFRNSQCYLLDTRN